MPFWAFAFALFVDILWAAAISYGAALVAQQFAKDPKKRLPDLANFPIQTSQKGIAIPKVYGCERVAGNVIWMGVQQHYEKKTHQPGVDGHVRIKTYFKDFMVGIAEGSGFVTKIWNGKDLIWAADGSGTLWNNDTQIVTVATAPTTAPASVPPGAIRLSNGDGTQDARFFTGEDFGKYDDLIWAYFENFETGPTPNIPNFSFEICTQTGYKYTYISENGSIWGIPLFGQTTLTLDEDGVAVDIGGGIVGLPCKNNPFKSGEVIRLAGTTNYENNHTLTSGTSEDQLQFADAFNAETFDGTEIPVKLISALTTSGGDMVQDSAGNLYYGSNWSVANSSYITKIHTDGTLTYDDFTGGSWPIDAWPGQIRSMAINHEYLWVSISQTPVASEYQYLQKYNLATGALEWSVFAGWFGGYDMDIDADGNAYVAGVAGGFVGTGDLAKFDAEDGAKTDYDDSPALYNVIVSNALDLVLTTRNNTVYVRTLDNQSGASLAIGSVLGTGAVAIINGVIYLLAAGLIYKIQVDFTAGAITGLTTVTTVTGPTNQVGLYRGLDGNIVIINQDAAGAQDDLMYFYDTDLNLLSNISGMPSSMLKTWAGGASAWIEGNAVFFPGISADAEDENPAIMVKDLAQQNRYGAGITDTYIDLPSFETETLFWDAEKNRISLSITEQVPLLDWVDFILSHCNGYRFWSEGKLHIGAFKNEASIVSLTTDDLIREEGPDAAPPVQIVKRKASETSNRIEINWTNRAATYDLASAMEQDEVDQRVSGKVRIKASDLTGIHNATLAQKQALRLLIETMYRFSMYSFSVSYKNMLYTVGDVIDITDGQLLTSQRMRILAREEDKDGREIKIDAVEDIAGFYPDVNYGIQQTLHVPDTPVGSDDLVTGTLNFREHVTVPNLYLFFAPGDSDTDGALVYRSFDNITYEFVGRIVFDKDTLPNSAGTTTSALPRAKAVMHRKDESFTVNIGDITSLRTDVSDEDFFNNQSLAKIGDEIIAFKAAEDQGGGIWQITQTIRGLFGTEAIEHPAGVNFATVSLIDLLYRLDEEVAGQTIYFKALATWGETVSQTLADVAATSYEVIREHERPYPLSIQGVKDAIGLCTVNAFPVVVEFNLASKEAGYNLGGHGDVGWGNFNKDTRIVGINVTLKTSGGTQISFEFHSLDGYHATDYELTITNADRLGNDPVLVEMAPVTSLPSSKATANTIDLVP